MVEHEKTYKDIPTVALRGLVVLPGEMLHFDAGRPKSVHALNRAMDEEGLIFVSAQKDPKISEIEPDDIYETGTLCALRQVLPMPGDSARVFVEGVCRALAMKVRDGEEGFSADIEVLEDEEYKPAKAEALRAVSLAGFRKSSAPGRPVSLLLTCSVRGLGGSRTRIGG